MVVDRNDRLLSVLGQELFHILDKNGCKHIVERTVHGSASSGELACNWIAIRIACGVCDNHVVFEDLGIVIINECIGCLHVTTCWGTPDEENAAWFRVGGLCVSTTGITTPVVSIRLK